MFFTKKNKGQISIEMLIIIGIVIIAGIVIGTFYLSSINKKTSQASAIDDTTTDINNWVQDTNNASSYVCGNNNAEGTEKCDGSDMGKYTNKACSDLGYSSGDLDCHADCTLDVDGCS